jgi:hypothetical protein
MVEWRETGFKGYLVNNLGEIQGPRGRLLKQSPAGHPAHKGGGYLRVTIHHNGYRLTRYTHILVCTLFHKPKPEVNMVVAHLDGNKLNNAASNLAWKTFQENEQDKKLHGTYNHVGEKNPKAKLTLGDVLAVREAYATGIFTTQMLADVMGVRQPHISGILLGKSWT